MFERWSYLGYTLLFCLPPLALLWLRREFAQRMAPDLRRIAAATLVLTLYGSAIWPVARRMGAWAYADDRLLGIRLLGWVDLEDVAWWLVVSFLMASFVSLSRRYEDEGIDIVSSEARALLRSFACAVRGMRMLRLERNTTVHVAAALFVVLEAALLRVTLAEWLVLILAIAAVLALELFNSALERAASRVEARHDEGIRLIKDASAAAVLVASIAAALVGLGVFVPRVVASLP